MRAQILKLNKAGSPAAWINHETAAIAIAKDLVLWTMGDNPKTLRGGYRNTGDRSIMDIAPIIAVNGSVKEKKVPAISNKLLFARDEYSCMYCGNKFMSKELSRDHIIPQSRGGPNNWTNCITSCKRCNHRKNDRTPEEAGMELLAVPYEPNLYEWFALSGRNILADQMDYLRPKFTNLVA